MSIKKTMLVIAGLAVAFAFMVSPASAQTVDQLNAQIASLLSMIQQLQNQIAGTGTSVSGTSSYNFTRDLTLGATGADVTALQNFLISQGQSIPAGATGYFGAQTKAALAGYQAANGISPAVGYFGPITRANIHAAVVVTPPTTPGTPTTPGVLQGGAGSINDADFLSGLTNEEVGEDAEDVEVAGLTIEADDGSDINITAVRLDFTQGTANQDFEDYAGEVSIWFDGDEVARLDADEFDDDNNYDKTVSLESSAIIRAGDTGELVVAVSGVSNLDTNDIADTWTVEFESVRFQDAQGAVVTDSATGDINGVTRTFSFESFATSADVELKISEGDDSINDDRTIVIDDTDETDDVVLASYELEARGDSDLMIKKFGVNIDVTGAAHVDELISGSTTPGIRLVINGEEYGTAEYFDDADGSEVGTDEDILFDDVDFTIDAGDTVEVEIVAELNSTNGSADAGDTIAVTLGETETDQATLVDVDDETGEQLADADITGSVDAGPHSLFESGINVSFTGSDESLTVATIANNADSAEFKLKFKVTAVGENDIYIDGDVLATSTPSAGTDGLSWATTTDSTTGTTSAAISGGVLTADDGVDSGDTTTSGDKRFLVEDGTSRDFTLTVTIPAGGDSTRAAVKMTGIKWDTTSQDAMSYLYTQEITKFVSDLITGMEIR